MLIIDLTGMVTVVMGGSRGIGAGIVEAFARAGAITWFTHTGHPQHAERVARMVEGLRAEGCQVEDAVADASQSEATNAVIEQVTKKHGRLDVLVANVGQNQVRLAEDTSTQSWQQLIDINLSSAFYAVRAVLPTMVTARSGRILLIGSSAVYDGGGGAIDYAAAKAGLIGMMRYLARNYARHGVRTNVIHPAVIETDLLRERYGDAAMKQKLIDQVPIGRLGQPADIAGLAVFLASSWGDFICGQEILVDGGRTFYRGGPS